MPFVTTVKARYPRVFCVLKRIRSFLSCVMVELEPASASGAGVDADPPPFDPTVPGVPVSYPIKTLEELESRVYFESFHFPFNRANVKLQTLELPQRPRLLVCHDMAGGYLDDRFVQGGGNFDAYEIWHWYLIDVFVYFSHNLVTLPPPCWTNTAHRHGVKVLGAFIMEFDEGSVVASKLLLSKDSVHMYAARLTELAVALGFDGWLLNIEVPLKPYQIPNLKEFIRCLTQSMHSALPGSLVIWYDSVTIDGYLWWQNQLNAKNKDFFDLSDGIFINYTWKEGYPKQSGDVAGDRRYDVYTGIDVFGRGTFGGGQWTTNVALDVIKEADVSSAIFAPGWVYETKQPPDFHTAQDRWWSLVEKSWGIMQFYPNTLPFYSNFDQGHGLHVYNNGEQISNLPWNNISRQTFQPFLRYSEEAMPVQVSVGFREESYSSGGNLTFVGTLGNDVTFSTRLFLGELFFGSTPVKFRYSVKASLHHQLGLGLEFSSSSKEKKTVLVCAPGSSALAMSQLSNTNTKVITPRKLEKQGEWVVHEIDVNMSNHILREIKAVCCTSQSNVSDPLQYQAVLGDLRIVNSKDDDPNFPLADSWLVDASFVNWNSDSSATKLLSLKISWKLKDGNADIFPKFTIYIDKGVSASSDNRSKLLETSVAYLGVAFVSCYYVSELQIPSASSSVKFIIQIWGADGSQQKIIDSPFFILQV